MHKPVACFILAAGLGERLRPITDHIPKPLLPLMGIPVLQHALEKAAALGPAGIGVNLHYKRERIEEWVRRSPFQERITLFPEDPILDTGGALKNAEGFLGGSAFLVHNADIFSSIDLEGVVGHHRASGNLATLAVHDCPRFNHVAVDRRGLLRGVGKGPAAGADGERRVAFTGIAVYEPEFLAFLPEGKSSVVDAWLKAAAAGCAIGTLDVSGAYWSDIGTPAAYAATVVEVMKAAGETVYIHPSAQGCDGAELDGYLAIEGGSSIGQGAALRNCIVLPGTRIGGAEGKRYENCIVGPGITVPVSETEAGLAVDGETLIGIGGSDRKYFRVKRDGRTAVRMQCLPGDPDYARHIEYTRFFLKHAVPVPELIEEQPAALSALFEDLGDLSLYSWLKCPRDGARIEEMYRKVLDIAVLLHTAATGRAAECRYMQERIFDYDHLRWETGYFLERFAGGLKRAAPRDRALLDRELHRLAATVNAYPKTIVHRDFQSQNIMVVQGTPRLIDYQGARPGPPAYDLASLLWDPYARLDEEMRERLIGYYLSRRAIVEEGFDPVLFREALLPCRLQRHMQALGAYGFLSAVKGKKYFLKHVPECLRMLREETALVQGEYPELHALVAEL
ncbi:MAG: phosphotransferase [Nitrospirota bacterium]